jgi:hypothetical protein
MIIQVERSGGFSGIPMLARLDTLNLDDEDRNTVESLVSAADVFAMPASVQSKARGADRFHYAVHIEDGFHSHSTEVGEADATPELRELIQHVMLLAHSRRE